MEIHDKPMKGEELAAKLAKLEGWQWHELDLYQQVTYLTTASRIDRERRLERVKCQAERLAILDGRDWNTMTEYQRNGYRGKAKNQT